MLLAIVEETDPSELRFLGGSAFVDPSVYDGLLQHPTESLLAAAMALEIEQGTAFLSRRQVAEANRRGELILLHFFGTIDHLLAGGANVHEAVARVNSAWNFFHTGFNLKELVVETASEFQAAMLQQLFAQLVRTRPGPSGKPTWLLRVGREDAARHAANWPFVAMVPSVPRFGFSKQQQEVLELALLDFSDREIMDELRLTEDSLKKRWRSIYRVVQGIEPALFSGKTGADLRRGLLQRLRHNLVELRPYR